MSDIIHGLTPFFEDCYRRIHIREYAKIMRVSPPTAATLLTSYSAEKLLLKERYKNYIMFYANKGSMDFIDISRIYWRRRLKELIAAIERKLTAPTIMLFGSLSKAETRMDSDIDLAIFAEKKGLDLPSFEAKLKRKIQVFLFRSISDIRSRELANNILNGYKLTGRLSL